jgi:glycosidase
MDSHDTDRLASNIVNPDLIYDKMISVPDNRAYDVRKPQVEEVQVQKLIVFFQMMFPGAPMVYYGGEAGMWGADDPDERKPMVWPEFTYENESSHPFGKDRPVDPVVFDRDLFTYYQKLIRLRRDHEVIRRGTWEVLLTDNERDLVVLKRIIRGQVYLVALNNSDQPQEVSVQVKDFSKNLRYRELMTGRTILTRNGEVQFRLDNKSGAVFQPLSDR